MASKEKENVPLHQPRPDLPALASAASITSVTIVVPQGKKRTLIVKNDFEINLNDANIPATEEVVDAMRKRILELEEQIEGQGPAKRLKSSNDAEGEEPKAESSTSTDKKSFTSKADPKKVDAIRRKMWSDLQKEVKRDKYKFKGGPPKMCRIEEVMESDEWADIFISSVEYIRLVQPTPQNKPHSPIWIIEYPGDDAEKIFGNHFKELKGYRYSLGGYFARYAKGERIGLVELDINYIQVTYSRNTMKCGIKFEVEEANPYRCGLDESDEEGPLVTLASVYDYELGCWRTAI